MEGEYVLRLNPDADIGLDAIEEMTDLLDGLSETRALAPLHLELDGAPANPYHALQLAQSRHPLGRWSRAGSWETTACPVEVPRGAPVALEHQLTQHDVARIGTPPTNLRCRSQELASGSCPRATRARRMAHLTW